MANDFRSARFWAAEIIEKALHEGATAVDATLGNGHDALWLCGLVGGTGHVYGFDVQAEAVERSRRQIAEAVDLRPEVANLLSGDGVTTLTAHINLTGQGFFLIVR